MDKRVWKVLSDSTGKGSVNSALEAKQAIEYFQAHVALFVVTAGGLRDVYPDDVFVAPEAYAYEVEIWYISHMYANCVFSSVFLV